MTEYFFHDGQTEKGPYSLEQIKKEFLKQDTPVWYTGLSDWTKASEIEELKGCFKTTPPPLKSYTQSTNHTTTTTDTSQQKAPEYFDNSPVKKSYANLYKLLGIVAVVAVVGWLIYDNQSNANALEEVENSLTIQQQQEQQRLLDQQQKEEQVVLEEKRKQLDKDKINAANTEKNMGYRNNWRNYFSVAHNQYSYSEMGGISNLSVEVWNWTDKMVDEVQVKVNYMKASGGVYKSEMVSITNIAPESQKVMSAPESDRGTSVTMEIVGIHAKSFHFCYPDGMAGNKDFDPFFCK